MSYVDKIKPNKMLLCIMCKFLQTLDLEQKFLDPVQKPSFCKFDFILTLQLWKQRILLNYRTSVRVERKH